MNGKQLVAAWLAAWQSGEPARVAALYKADATHSSARVLAVWPELGRDQLRGLAEIEAYAARAFANGRRLAFEPIQVFEAPNAVAVEYWAENSLAPGKRARVMECFEIEGGKIAACRVFHGH